MSEHCKGCMYPEGKRSLCPGITCTACAEKDMRYLDDKIKLGALQGQLDGAREEIARLTAYEKSRDVELSNREIQHSKDKGKLEAEIARLRSIVALGRYKSDHCPGCEDSGFEDCPGVTCPACQEKDAEIARLKGAVRRLSGALTALDRSYASQFSPGHERMTKEVLADPMD